MLHGCFRLLKLQLIQLSKNEMESITLTGRFGNYKCFSFLFVHFNVRNICMIHGLQKLKLLQISVKRNSTKCSNPKLQPFIYLAFVEQGRTHRPIYFMRNSFNNL